MTYSMLWDIQSVLTNGGSTQFDYGYSRSSKLYVLVVVAAYAVDCVEILSDVLSECSRACAMKYAHTLGIESYGIVDVVCYDLYGFVYAHSAHVDFLFEVELSLPLCVGCGTDERCSRFHAGGGLGYGASQTIYRYLGL